MPRTLAQRRTDAAREMALVTELGRARRALHAPNTLTAVATALRAGLIT